VRDQAAAGQRPDDQAEADHQPGERVARAAARALRERKKEQTRAAIAHAAVGLFLEQGYDRVSIADVAAAAGVAKMTVTNYFPAKEDLVISAGASVVPDLVAVVRSRRPGETVLAALLRFVRAELDNRSEWTALHDGVTQFARMSMASPALSEAFARVWDRLQADLAQALDEISGGRRAPAAGAGNGQAGPTGDADEAGPAPGADAVPGGEMTLRMMKLIWSGDASEPERAGLTAAMTLSRFRAQVAAAQITGTLRALTGANLIRQAAGLSADQTAAQSHAETTAAFEMLESGLGRLYD
jgi:AcrR family transcriptional regulator